MHNVSENFTLNSLSNEFPSTTIQFATDCFRLGRAINQFRRLGLPIKQSLNTVEGSEPTYSFLISLNTDEHDDSLGELHDADDADDDAINDDDEDNLFFEMNIHAGHYGLCRAKATHDAVLEKKMLLSPGRR